jgi:hypothetical protein
MIQLVGKVSFVDLTEKKKIFLYIHLVGFPNNEPFLTSPRHKRLEIQKQEDTDRQKGRQT